MNRAEILEQIEETREKLQELEKELESYKLKKYRIVLEVETNPVDWGCSEDQIINVINDYIIQETYNIMTLIQLGDPDDKLTLQNIFEVID